MRSSRLWAPVVPSSHPSPPRQALEGGRCSCPRHSSPAGPPALPSPAHCSSFHSSHSAQLIRAAAPVSPYQRHLPLRNSRLRCTPMSPVDRGRSCPRRAPTAQPTRPQRPGPRAASIQHQTSSYPLESGREPFKGPRGDASSVVPHLL